jgi:hypothetical protein
MGSCRLLSWWRNRTSAGSGSCAATGAGAAAPAGSSGTTGSALRGLRRRVGPVVAAATAEKNSSRLGNCCAAAGKAAAPPLAAPAAAATLLLLPPGPALKLGTAAATAELLLLGWLQLTTAETGSSAGVISERPEVLLLTPAAWPRG